MITSALSRDSLVKRGNRADPGRLRSRHELLGRGDSIFSQKSTDQAVDTRSAISRISGRAHVARLLARRNGPGGNGTENQTLAARIVHDSAASAMFPTGNGSHDLPHLSEPAETGASDGNCHRRSGDRLLAHAAVL